MIQVKQIEVLEILESAASDQWGIITTAQAQREGITRLQLGRLADKGVLTRVQRGIYLLPSSQYGLLADIRIAWVSLDAGQFPDERWEGEDAVIVSHESAALIHQLGDLIPKKMIFSSTARKQTSQDGIYIYNNRDISSRDISNVDGLPVASVELTVADLAKKKIEFNYLASVVVDALRKENIRLKDIAEYLNEAAHSYGFSSGRQLVLACQEEAEADDDREEKVDRYLSTQGWNLSTPDIANIVKGMGTVSASAQMANIIRNAGVISTPDIANIVKGMGTVSASAQMANIAKGMGAAGISGNLDNSNTKQPKEKTKKTGKEPSSGSLPSPSEQVHKQPKITDSKNGKKEKP